MLADSSSEKEGVETGHGLRGRLATTNKNESIKWRRRIAIWKLGGQIKLHSSEKDEIAILKVGKIAEIRVPITDAKERKNKKIKWTRRTKYENRRTYHLQYLHNSWALIHKKSFYSWKVFWVYWARKFNLVDVGLEHRQGERNRHSKEAQMYNFHFPAPLQNDFFPFLESTACARWWVFLKWCQADMPWGGNFVSYFQLYTLIKMLLVSPRNDYWQYQLGHVEYECRVNLFCCLFGMG